MTKTIITAVIILALLAGIVILLDNVRVPQTSPSPSAKVSENATPTPEETTGGIHVFSPSAGDQVGLPLVIKGEARVFEATFAYRIKNSKGTVLIEGSAMTTGTADYPAFRPFEVSINYPDPKTASGSVEVFSMSAKDGSEINKVIVPVTFKKIADAMTVKLFINVDNPVTTRIPKTDTPVRSTLDELLKFMGKGISINSVALKSGVLTVDLKGVVSATMKSQITKTAMQFPNVKSVVITVDGTSL